MRLIIDKILWGTLLILFGPTTMIVASWNALPGDNLYSVKLALEKAALALASPSYATSGNLQIKYTERRFAEAKQLMSSKQSIQGLPYLDQQIAETKKAIENAPNKESQIALAKQYINTLSTVSTDLETQKQSITQQIATPTPIPTNTPSPTPTPRLTTTPTPVPTSNGKEVPTSEVNRPTLQPTPTPQSNAAGTFDVPPIQVAQVATTTPISAGQAVAALQINQTQQHVSKTIADLQTLVDNDDRDQKNKNNDKKEDKRDKEEKDQKMKNEEKKSNDDGKSRNKDSKKTD